MKSLTFLLFAFVSFTPVFSQKKNVRTEGDKSPAVIADSLSISYGVRADAIEAILWIYNAKGYDEDRRKRAIEQILNEYALSPEKQYNDTELSQVSRNKMGIADLPEIADALEWDLFAHKYYLCTTGDCSPAVIGNVVKIWYGIPEKALRSLAKQLEKNKTDYADFEKQLEEQAKKLDELSKSLVNREDEMAKEAKLLLEDGKIEEAVKVLSDRRYSLKKQRERSEKREAEAAFDYAKGLLLQIKYDSAAVQYKAAIELDPENSTYHRLYADNEHTLAHYDEAITHFEIALSIDTLETENGGIKASLLSSLGMAWEAKGEYDKAIRHLEEALQIGLTTSGERHPDVAAIYSNLGYILDSKGEYGKAIEYFEKSIEIYLTTYGEQHPDVAGCYNNLGLAWHSKGEYDKAIEYFGKSLEIHLTAFGKQHPEMARNYNNFGLAWHSKGEYDKAIECFEKALQIDLVIYGEQHPEIARYCDNLGSVWLTKGEYDKAIGYFEKALQIGLITLGERHRDIARYFKSLGTAWKSKGEYDKAIGYFEKALQIGLITLGERHPDIASYYNSLGTTWQLKEEYDKAIGYIEKALQIGLATFGERHRDVASYYNNLGLTLESKGEHDKAIEYLEKALQIGLATFGKHHTRIATFYNNLGLALQSKEEYDKAIEYFEKALQIDLAIFGEQHPNLVNYYINLGSTWEFKGEYDKAIEYYEKGQIIVNKFFEPTHPYQIHTAISLCYVTYRRAIELHDKEKYEEALLYCQKGLKNAELTDDIVFVLKFLNTIGSIYKHIKNYEQGLFTLELGIQKAEQLNQEIDRQFKERLTSEMLVDPEMQKEIAQLKNLFLIRRMKYHKVGCLKGLKRDTESEALAKQLWKEGIKAKDDRLLEDLKKDGYHFRH